MSYEQPTIGIMMVGIIDHAYASSKIARSNDQQNSCGNDALITNIICQNNNSKDHDRNNAWFSKFEVGADDSEKINQQFLIQVKRIYSNVYHVMLSNWHKVTVNTRLK